MSDTPAARLQIARDTLDAVDAGRYVNPRGEVVALAVADAVAGTVLHELGEPLRPPAGTAATAIAVTAESTIAALVRLDGRPGGHLGCLNFASGKHPGGGFLRGTQAQEESLARSSALYPCLLRQPAYYERNRAHGAAYLDLAIYSPRVPVFRDDAGGWLDRAVLASIITCPAPNARDLRDQGALDERSGITAAALAAMLHRRAGLVLAVAAHHQIERLVLGAWGAGVFGNDPEVVADAFGAELDGRFAGAFAEVVFAIQGGPGRPNHDAFARRFGAG